MEGQAGQDGRIELVFGFLDSGVKGFGGVGGQDGHVDLVEDGTAVDGGVDPVNGAAGFGDSGTEGLFPGAQAGEGGQEGGMDVEDATGEGVEEGGFEDAHVAGEDDEVRLGLEEGAGEFGFDVRFEFGFEGTGWAGVGEETALSGGLEDGGVWVVGADEDDGGWKLAGVDGIGDGKEVGAAT